MTPEQLNRVAMWGTIGILVVAGVVFAGRWAIGSTDDADLVPVVAQPGVSDLSPTIGVPEAVLVAGPVESPEGAEAPEPPSVVLSEHIEEPARTTPASNPPPTSTTSTTTATAPPEDPRSAPTTSPPPTLPTTTTTTAPTTTTTASPPPTLPTTTTAPTTTTTTTLAPISTTTTTTVSDLPGLFLERFDGQANGDSDEWSVRLDVDVGGTVAGTYRGQVFVSWSGDGSGSAVLSTGGSGNASATVGPFRRSPVTLTVTNIYAAGWTYLPSLNQASTTLIIEAPDD